MIDGAVFEIYANEKLMQQQKYVLLMPPRLVQLYVARDNQQYLGYILIADTVKDDAAACIRRLKAEGLIRLSCLLATLQETAEYVASQIGLTEVHCIPLLPGDKVDEVESSFSPNRLRVSWYS